MQMRESENLKRNVFLSSELSLWQSFLFPLTSCPKVHEGLCDRLPLGKPPAGNLLTSFTEPESPTLRTGRHFHGGLLLPLDMATATSSGRRTLRQDATIASIADYIRATVGSFVSYVQATYPDHTYVYFTILVNEPMSEEQKLLHTDFDVGAEEKLLPAQRPMTFLFPVNLSCGLRICEDGNARESSKVREIDIGWCAKFSDQIYHAGARNDYDAVQYRVQLKFAQHLSHLGAIDGKDIYF